jgi:hypothetical protein
MVSRHRRVALIFKILRPMENRKEKAKTIDLSAVRPRTAEIRMELAKIRQRSMEAVERGRKQLAERRGTVRF